MCMNNINNINKVINDMNMVFSNTDNDIRDFIHKFNKTKTRKSKISFINAFIHSLCYCDVTKTKMEITNNFNFKNEKNIKINRTSFYEKEKLIPVDFFTNVFNKITKVYYNNFKLGDDFMCMAVDGTYNNTNQYNIKNYLETSLNLGFFDATNDIPTELTFDGIKNKNNELESLKSYLVKNKTKFNNCIFVLDRAYSSYEIIKYFNDNNIKYIVRFKNNSKNIPDNNRIIKFTNTYQQNVKNDDIDKKLIDGKKFKYVVLETKNDYTLVTNLNNNYTNDKIKELYKKRWNVEIFFKIIKSNFKMSDLRITNIEQNDNPYIIHNIKIMIIMVLTKIFSKIGMMLMQIKENGIIKRRNYKNKKAKKINNAFDVGFDIYKHKKRNNIRKKDKKKKNNKIKCKTEEKNINISIANNKNVKINKKDNICKTNSANNETKCVFKPNVTNIIKGVYNIIDVIINGSLTYDIVSKFIKCHFACNKVDTSINNKRICKTPFKKWYVKGYTNKSDIVKIVDLILGFTKNNLNKNLMMKYKNCIITHIEYID